MKLRLLFIPLLIASVGLAATTYSHELVHINAYKYKGYNNTSMHFTFSTGAAYVENHDNIDIADANAIYLANITNDAIGYNLTVPLLLIVLGIYQMNVFLLYKKEAE